MQSTFCVFYEVTRDSLGHGNSDWSLQHEAIEFTPREDCEWNIMWIEGLMWQLNETKGKRRKWGDMQYPVIFVQSIHDIFTIARFFDKN